MNDQKKTNQLIWIIIPVVGIAVIAGAIYAVINSQTPEGESPEQAEPAVTNVAPETVVSDNPPEEIIKAEPAVTNVTPEAAVSDISLEDIVKSAQTWGAGFKSWHGKSAPDFTVNDIEGKQHSLSSYRGKNVMVVFWATWCPPCKREIPHLIELRKQIGEEELAIIAISNESPGTLKPFVNSKGINYSVASAAGTKLPSPFADVRSIPTAFYIDRNGQIKLATVGLVEKDDTKKILEALG
jgi:peroxiredoxin